MTEVFNGHRLAFDVCQEFQCGCWGETIDKNGIQLISVEIPSQLEPICWERTDSERSDGVTLIPWSKGKCLI